MLIKCCNFNFMLTTNAETNKSQTVVRDYIQNRPLFQNIVPIPYITPLLPTECEWMKTIE